MKRASFGLLVLGLIWVGCGDRLQFAHRVNLTAIGLPASRAVPEIEALIDEETLELLGGSLPEVWPEEVPPISVRVSFVVVKPIERAGLNAVGDDLARVSGEEFELRVRGIDWSFDHRDITHPIDDVEVWVGPEGAGVPGDEGTLLVGYLDGLDAGFGQLTFTPGGRRALGDNVTAENFVLIFRPTLIFDSAENPQRPDEMAVMSLVLHLDVLH